LLPFAAADAAFGLLVRRALDADPRTGQYRWTSQTFRYASCRDAELGYAVTDHAAQGRTVHTGLAVPPMRRSACSLAGPSTTMSPSAVLICGAGRRVPRSPRAAAAGTRATAFERGDVTGLVAVLTEDASWEMPPIPTWFAGRDAIVAFLAGRQRMIGCMPAIPITANGQPALAFYARDAAGVHRPHALHVLTLTKAGISRIVSFQDPGLFPLFGLPPVVCR
jgi:SnoaL-like domain